MSLFTLTEARATLEEMRSDLDAFVGLRADAAELAAAVRSGEPSPLGGRPELKALEAHLDEVLTRIQETGVEVKSFAPLLLDFPSDLDGEDVQLCWLEGDTALEWYHRADLGFVGRRRLPG